MSEPTSLGSPGPASPLHGAARTHATYIDDAVYHRLVHRLAEFQLSPLDGGPDRNAVILVLADVGIWPRSLSSEALGSVTSASDGKPDRNALIFALSQAGIWPAPMSREEFSAAVPLFAERAPADDGGDAMRVHRNDHKVRFADSGLSSRTIEELYFAHFQEPEDVLSRLTEAHMQGQLTETAFRDVQAFRLRN